MALNDKQARFCEEYMKDLNGTQAAIRAGYSPESATSTASEILRYPDVQNRISELQAALRDKNEGLAQAVIDELKKVGFANIQDYIEDGNVISNLKKIPKEQAAAVASVKKSITTFDGGEKEVVEFKLWDKLSALEKIGKHLGIFEADNKQKATNIVVEPVTGMVIKKKDAS